MFHSSIKSYSILGIRRAKVSSCLIKEPGETEEIGKNCPHERGKIKLLLLLQANTRGRNMVIV